MGLEVGNFEVLGHLFAVQIHLQSIYHQRRFTILNQLSFDDPDVKI